LLRRRPAPAFLRVLIALGATTGTASCDRPPTAGFWYEAITYALPADETRRLGGALEPSEIDAIQQMSRAELGRAFSGLRIRFTQGRSALWRVSVLDTVSVPGTLPTAGESQRFGAFGGAGSVGFVTLAAHAIEYAPSNASRHDIVEGIGRGIGRATAHEFAHQILGALFRDNDADVDSFEYFSSDRRSQYYGELRWTSAWALLREKLGS
jgi:hypothetical protein